MGKTPGQDKQMDGTSQIGLVPDFFLGNWAKPPAIDQSKAFRLLETACHLGFGPRTTRLGVNLGKMVEVCAFFAWQEV
jgi:hypothetical protein